MSNYKVASSACLGALMNKSSHKTCKTIKILHSKTKMFIKNIYHVAPRANLTSSSVLTTES